MELENKVAIVTGGSSGIGKAISELFEREGATVVVADLNAPEAAISKNIRKSGSRGRIDFVKTDVSDSSQVKELIDYTLREFGRIDIVCNNAGILITKNLVDTTEQEWDSVIDTNLKGAFLVSRHALPGMIERKQGTIVNTASQLGIVGLEGCTAYCASKGGIILLTKSMALEYAKYGIRVNCVCPGAINTPMVEREVAGDSNPSKAREDMIARHPLGRLGRPEEIAQAVLFLATERSSFATGSYLVVDGGYVVQ